MPLHKGEGSKDEYNSYRKISFLSVLGKMYGRILMERLMEVTAEKVREEYVGLGPDI